MFDEIKKKLYFAKYTGLFNKGIKEGKITNFEEEIFDKMSNTIIACLPVSLYIKYAKYLFGEGTCYDRSLYMFLALEDAILVRGDDKALEYKYGKGHEGHGWIEIGDFVYDPAIMLKFDRDTYYELYGCSNLHKIDKKTYLENHKQFFDSHVSHDFNEFKPNGKRRLELGMLIRQIKILCENVGDERFTQDINNYLSLIEYDENQIHEERKKSIQKILTSDIIMSVVRENKK